MAEKIVKIGEREISLRASGATQIIYNNLFPGRDYMLDLNRIMQKYEKRKKNGDDIPPDVLRVILNVAYCMHYQTLSRQEQREFRTEYPTVYEWLDTFEMFDVYELIPQVLDLWKIDKTRLVEIKKKNLRPYAK